MILLKQFITLPSTAFQQLTAPRMILQVDCSIVDYAPEAKPSRLLTAMLCQFLGTDGSELGTGFVLVHDLEVLDVGFTHLAGCADDALVGHGLGLVVLVGVRGSGVWDQVHVLV